MRAQLVSVAAGLVRTAAGLLIESTDEEVLAVALGQTAFRAHVPTGPGPAELWRDWHPPAQEESTIRRAVRGNLITASAKAQATATARRLTAEELAKLPPPRERPPDWRAWALPGRETLAVQGGSSRGGPPPERPKIQPILYFDAPPADSDSIEFSLEQLWTYRFAGSRATVPSPQPDRSMPLAGMVLEGAGCRVELLQWDPVDQNGFRLTARCDPPDAWPDLRVMSESASASLWCEPPTGVSSLRVSL